MKTLSITVEFLGNPIKIENGKVYGLAFGTTINDHSMHHSWCEIPKSKMSEKLKIFLQNNNLI